MAASSNACSHAAQCRAIQTLGSSGRKITCSRSVFHRETVSQNTKDLGYGSIAEQLPRIPQRGGGDVIQG